MSDAAAWAPLSPSVGLGPGGPDVAAGADARPFRVYAHIPFCAVRCGYCDFNTYTAAELGPGAAIAEYAGTAAAEVRLAARTLAELGLPARPVSSVFFGGGTPTLLRPADLLKILDSIRAAWGLADACEVTIEANPDSVDETAIAALVDGGATRFSFGMQSAAPRVLRTLDRTHDPAQVSRAVGWAKRAGASTSVDLIYATPGESAEDWQASLDTAIALETDHVSAYALVIEPGTKMGAALRRGVIPPVDDDIAAERYEAADAALVAAGFAWYEVSNWARAGRPATRSAHNLGYWRSDDWWGIGPGAHSKLGGLETGESRWWNIRHPRPYAEAVLSGRLPVAGHEQPDQAARRLEAAMLALRLDDGLPLAALGGSVGRADDLVVDGLLDPVSLGDGVARLTLRGRLLADAVLRHLTA